MIRYSSKHRRPYRLHRTLSILLAREDFNRVGQNKPGNRLDGHPYLQVVHSKRRERRRDQDWPDSARYEQQD